MYEQRSRLVLMDCVLVDNTAGNEQLELKFFSGGQRLQINVLPATPAPAFQPLSLSLSHGFEVQGSDVPTVQWAFNSWEGAPTGTIYFCHGFSHSVLCRSGGSRLCTAHPNVRSVWRRWQWRSETVPPPPCKHKRHPIGDVHAVPAPWAERFGSVAPELWGMDFIWFTAKHGPGVQDHEVLHRRWD